MLAHLTEQSTGHACPPRALEVLLHSLYVTASMLPRLLRRPLPFCKQVPTHASASDAQEGREGRPL